MTGWLAERMDGLAPPLRWTRLTGGHSNFTYRVDDEAGGTLVLRRPLAELLPTERATPESHRSLTPSFRSPYADTTVVAANVAYPTDSGLLAKGVAKMAVATRKLKSAGLASRTAWRDRTRSMRRRAHDIGAWLRRRSDEARAEVSTITAEMAAIAGARRWAAGRR